MMGKRILCVILVLMLLVGGAVALAACGGGSTTETTAATTATTAGGTETTAGGTETTAGGTETTGAATGEPIIVGFNEGFTGFMATNALLCWHGIVLACEQVGQINGRPIEYNQADNGSDPAQAVAKARQQVESDGVDVMIGPQFSPSTQAITDYLATAGGIPQISVAPQPNDNLTTANGLAFMAYGFYGNPDMEYAKYLVTTKGFKSVNIICYEDTASRQQIAKGFIRASLRLGVRFSQRPGWRPTRWTSPSSWVACRRPTAHSSGSMVWACRLS